MYFADRAEAGRKLAEHLISYRDRAPVVLALPRGGVPVAFEVASALGAPLDLVLVRKIGMPFEPELALGAIVDGDRPELVIDQHLKAEFRIPDAYIEEEKRRCLTEIERRRVRYLAGRRPVPLEGRTAILVDDGLATGATMRVSIRGTRRRNPASIVVAVPVAPAETIESLRLEADDIVCLHVPEYFAGVGGSYRDFHQIDDDTVTALLAAAAQFPKAS